MKRSLWGALCALTLLMFLVFATAAFASVNTKVHYGTMKSDWGPAKTEADGSPSHKNWPLPMPEDCSGATGRNGDIVPMHSAEANNIHGKAGCDFFWANDGRDVVHLGPGMDAGYGGQGNDHIYGGPGHDHIFGDSGPDKGGGNDYIDTRDGHNEPMHHEEIMGGPGVDHCWFDPDPDGIQMNSCEYLNGSKNPFPVEKYINTTDEGNQIDMRGKINHYLAQHGGTW